MENLRSIQDSLTPLSDTRIMKRIFIFIFIFYYYYFFFLLKANLLLHHNSLIVKQKKYGFDIKALILFIDCLKQKDTSGL